MIRVNLLSPEKKEVSGGAEAPGFTEEKRESKVSTLAVVVAVLITVGIIGFMYITQDQTIKEKENLLEEKTAHKVRLKDVESTLQELEKAKSDLARKVGLISELKSRQQSAVRMMDELSDSLPEWVWLSSLTFSGNRLSLRGRAIHNNLIADFINNLKATNSFTDIRFQSSTKQKQAGLDVFNFDLSCVYVEKSINKTNKAE
jgi:type IV pilus assembly protein PilN